MATLPAEAIFAHTSEIRQFRFPKTIAPCEQNLALFGSRYQNPNIDRSVYAEKSFSHYMFPTNSNLRDLRNIEHGAMN